MKCVHGIRGGCIRCNEVSDKLLASMKDNDMMVGIKFHEDGTVTEGGRNIQSKHWLGPMMSPVIPLHPQFSADLRLFISQAGVGYDPRNHIGNRVAISVFGLTQQFDNYLQERAA